MNEESTFAQMCYAAGVGAVQFIIHSMSDLLAILAEPHPWDGVPRFVCFPMKLAPAALAHSAQPLP
eukprot:305690-Pelagomonas_calceolata.AAC.4